jgi:transcription elongation factor GreA
MYRTMSALRPFPLTPAGLARLKEELHRLKSVERPKISQEIGTARELGDLSENFEYHAAKDKQGMVEARIRVLEDQVSRAEVIDPAKLSGDRVVFGARVQIADIHQDDTRIYQIVGESESDLDQQRISVASPLARALIGREVGDEVRIPGKGGKPRMVEIVDVSFPGAT